MASQPAATTTGCTAVEYRLEIWLTVGGFRVARGSIEADPQALQALLPAARALLHLADGGSIEIEVVSVSGRRAAIRVPRHVKASLEPGC